MRMRKKVERDLAEELRCRRGDSRNWRCCNPRVEGSSYCQHHRDMFRSRCHTSKKDRSQESKTGLKRQCPASKFEIKEPEKTETNIVSLNNNNKRKIKEPEITETTVSSNDRLGLDNLSEIGLPANLKRRKIITDSCEEGLMIGITKQCISGKYKIREPHIAETTVLPLNILLLDDLRNVLTVKTWRENLSAAERCKLRTLLPKGQKNVVESLLNGENFHFGNPVIKWGSDVCQGQQQPEALLKKESELKICQSQYFRDLRTYHHTFIERIDELEEVCELYNHDESKFLQELKRWRPRSSTEGNRKM